ncbi:acyl-CoA dehydrogenase family protein [Ottowia thiooxydans]|uniref:acyl-CoA dehydrogenase family protein n=1 Tax=Ottowia thiooxydans TaxID=219182 RepID=UPI000411EE12|nr:acyl-CoA dehydrogenase family protein [Ottowia thiooxydans]
MQNSHEQVALRSVIRRFIAEEVDPNAQEWERRGAFPAHEVFRRMAELGLTGVSKPVEYGGLGLDFSWEVLVAEELGHCSIGALPMAFGVQTCMGTPALARFGSDELRREFLAPVIAGDYVAAVAVSEPQAGSDVAGLKCKAVRDGGEYVVTGTKMWITNALQADFFCVLANTSDEPSHRNKSMFIVPAKQRGIAVSKPLDKLGMRSSETSEIVFDGVRVPASFMVGEEGEGFRNQMVQFQDERLYVAATTLRAMERCIDTTADYCRERMIFGSSVLGNQAVQFRLAELQVDVEALRSLVYRATDAYVAGEDVTLLATMAKLKAGRLARVVTDSCLQYWGGMGFMWDNPVSRYYRDLRLLSIGGGSDETMLQVIAKMKGFGSRR